MKHRLKMNDGKHYTDNTGVKMSAHNKNSGHDIGKKGMTVHVKRNNALYGEDLEKFNAKSLDSAIKTLKRRMVQEGVIRDVRRKEFYETKSQIRRKKKEVAIRKQKLEEKNKEW